MILKTYLCTVNGVMASCRAKELLLLGLSSRASRLRNQRLTGCVSRRGPVNKNSNDANDPSAFQPPTLWQRFLIVTVASGASLTRKGGDSNPLIIIGY